MLDPKLAACKGKCLGLVAAIFVFGMMAGAFSLKLAERYWVRPAGLTLDGAEKELAVQHFSRELELSEVQARDIENILDEFIMQQSNLMTEFRNSRLSGQEQIIRVLNEDQRRRFQKVLAELNTTRKD